MSWIELNQEFSEKLTFDYWINWDKTGILPTIWGILTMEKGIDSLLIEQLVIKNSLISTIKNIALLP